MTLAYTRQPIADIIRRGGYTHPDLAERCGVPVQRFRDVVSGRGFVPQGMRDHLPNILGYPLEQLFHSSQLECLPKTYRRRAKVSK